MKCEYCAGDHDCREQCPRISAIDYYESGTVKRVGLGYLYCLGHYTQNSP